MVDDGEENWRDLYIISRQKRWSMNSQRLEGIVAELMKPIVDIRRSFDTDLASLLEEYLTEAGLRVLDADVSSYNADPMMLNFAEAALLLQQSADNYGRKVDYLYQHVLAFSDSLQSHMQEAEISQSVTPRRERRRRAEAAPFEHIELAASAGCRRDAERAKPPPLLRRVYAELEPRPLVACDAPLLGYDGAPLGLLPDFGVALRLHLGVLVDELEGYAPCAAPMRPRPPPLLELQAAIEAAAPPDPPPPPDTDLTADFSADFTTADADADAMPPPTLVATAKALKRRLAVPAEEMVGLGHKLHLTDELRQRLSATCDFALSARLITSVVRRRMREILAARRRLRESWTEAEFLGWSAAEVAAAEAAALRQRRHSDDDGFCESGDDAHSLSPGPAPELWAEWAQRAERLASESAARGDRVEVKALARGVLAALPASPLATTSVDALLRRTARAQPDVSITLLGTLFLANRGILHIEKGPPLTINSFSVRVVSTDERLLSAAMEADERASAPAASPEELYDSGLYGS